MSLNNSRQVKICIAGAESPFEYEAIRCTGYPNALSSPFRLLAPKVGVRPCRFYKNDVKENLSEYEEGIFKKIAASTKFSIIDSGVFSLMTSQRHNVTKPLIYKWYDLYVDFLNNLAPKSSVVVEVDIQSVLGQEIAWDLRNKFNQDMSHRERINVFHLCDGQYGLDKLIANTSYIGLSIPEFESVYSNNRPSNKVKELIEKLCFYIKSKNPNMKIHALGTSSTRYLPALKNIITSSDSTSISSFERFGKRGEPFGLIRNCTFPENLYEQILVKRDGERVLRERDKISASSQKKFVRMYLATLLYWEIFNKKICKQF